MSLTVIIIVVTVVMSIAAWNRPDRMAKWILNPYRVSQNREYYRFISSGMIHNDYMHLFINMFVFYSFGTIVEQIFRYMHGSGGYVYYLILYFAGMVVADIPSFIKYRNMPGYNSLGASGAVSAVVFSSILFNPTDKILLFFIIPMPGFVFALLYLIYSYFEGRRMAGNVNHDAHLYGALFGIVFTVIIYPQVLVSFLDKITSYKLF